MTDITFFQVDAFTDVPFKGNPAAICLLRNAISDDLMQKIAAENNLAETAFLLRTDSGFNLRWFTPTVEIKLCGHGTLATAHVLWEKGILKENEQAVFHTLSGLLTVTKNEEWLQLDFPKFSYKPVTAAPEMLKALGVTPVNSVCAEGDGRYVIEIADKNQLLAIKPDFPVLINYPSIVVTCRADSDSRYDFFSRSFAASHGINEDPVTGSSHCVLAPYWADKLEKTELLAFQESARGGELRLKLAGDRVLIEGKAVTVIEGVMKYRL